MCRHLERFLLLLGDVLAVDLSEGAEVVILCTFGVLGVTKLGLCVSMCCMCFISTFPAD